MPKIVVYLSALILFLYFRPPVFADSNVLINEFYALGFGGDDPDWVELYNKSDNPINLEGWVIRDGTNSNKIKLAGYICSKNFRRFNFSNKLDKGGDKIRLLDSESATTPLDEIVYFSDAIPVHSQGQSTGRNPDGDGTWILMTSPTPTDDNSCTPTPSPTPPPTSQSSTSQSSPSTAGKSKSPSPSPKNSPSSASSKTTSPKTTSVLGSTATESPPLATPSASTSPSPSPSPLPLQVGGTRIKIAGVVAGSGAIIMGVSVGLYLWYKKRFATRGENKEQT